MRVGYFGPEGTFTHEALIDADARRRAGAGAAADDLRHGDGGPRRLVERALVPIENSLEGSVNATLDALAMETEDVAIVGEVVHPIRHCLIARTALELSEIEAVVSHPQATAQCARFIRTRLPGARVLAGSSTADAVRMVAEHDGRLGGARATGSRPSGTAAWCCAPGSRTWPTTRPGSCGWARPGAAGPGGRGAATAIGPWKTAIVFWGVGSEAPGWLVSCLSELAAARGQPDPHRVAPAQAGTGPLHVLRRPRGARHRAARRGGARGAARPRRGAASAGFVSRGVTRRLGPAVARSPAGYSCGSPPLHWRRAMATSVPAPVRSAPPSEHQRRGREVGRVLVLNATYEPINVCTVRRAVVLLLKEQGRGHRARRVGASLGHARRSRARW